MDKNIIGMIVGCAIYGTVRPTYLKILLSGQEFKNPQIISVQNCDGDRFGVIDPDEPDQTFIFYISDVDIIY